MRSNQAPHVLDVSGCFFESLDAEDDDARSSSASTFRLALLKGARKMPAMSFANSM